MEITFVAPHFVKIRGKRATISVNPNEKTSATSGVIIFGKPSKEELKVAPDTVVFNGPGEYEVGGIKITGIQSDTDVLYSVSVDGVEVLLGRLISLEKAHTKLKEHNLLLVCSDTETDPSFLTSFSPNAVLFFGKDADACAKSFGNERMVKANKYAITLEKLPLEMETVLLN